MVASLPQSFYFFPSKIGIVSFTKMPITHQYAPSLIASPYESVNCRQRSFLCAFRPQKSFKIIFIIKELLLCLDPVKLLGLWWTSFQQIAQTYEMKVKWDVSGIYQGLEIDLRLFRTNYESSVWGNCYFQWFSRYFEILLWKNHVTSTPDRHFKF